MIGKPGIKMQQAPTTPGNCMKHIAKGCTPLQQPDDDLCIPVKECLAFDDVLLARKSWALPGEPVKEVCSGPV